ncbi:MAG: serine--tRNA ligase [Candidatus Staskawiczbacteria bacterium RIFOXYC1_FULL_37_43]|nr:MAG: serine--tRNA ligase [Candidatus Staskawiczbacteria bacterium RIFCSPHIGHO2_01_FULL_37_17]OGZ71196.1 MAG: serine--tRNA ligase [Candidatus Staskawiczbacteria bacterium RIFCSPLOWO2_01_FULL_37_19]OGZ76024.1 MAG: serine--tRNA ligase [Candidatus Staskawiczbacteria bacterium RIFOXYA1_FULL_37_15]OGZ79993.1 MAG: serine--tRNA ligase [Candidatus Staskawiczbacteria bacterium RIFOXYB1_FULL_38_37]OGZ81563.1 MAG: serine--tRNA ligase [Candidatus Staskawiczbacteria bacterium RIFOXYB2_FULL_37_10]OGZ81633
MLDVNFIRENSNKVKEACEKKQTKVDVDKILELDKQKRKLMTEMENLKAEQNKISRLGSPKPTGEGGGGFKNEPIIEQAKEIKGKIKEMEPELERIENELNPLLLQLPNIPFDDVPVGKNESENVIMRQVGKKPKFSFTAKDYMQLGKDLDLIDTERAGKVAGSRFGYLKNELPLLEFALINLVMDIARNLLAQSGEKFVPVIPPVMLKEEMARGTGYFEATDEKEAYYLAEDKMFLAGTSEQPMVAMHANEVLNEKDLPKRYVAFSTCFRREAGSYGKDTKGILRVHQFDKLEMVIFSKQEDSKKEHQLLLSIEEKLMKALGLPYQVINICTGDLGRPAACKYDIETWLPSENKYRETHSTSNCTDFQARRLNIRYKDKSGKMNFAHTLNGTAFAIGRILIMIMENYQQKDGSIRVPKALQKYCGFKVIK